MSKYLLITGGVGGARLCDGFYRSARPQDLTILVNTGDDFEHCGLHISPDVDTLLYTLSEQADSKRGWGLQNETWDTLERLGDLGGETWFQLGDQDLATHLRRTAMLRAGSSLESVVKALAQAMGIGASVIPMSSQPLRTVIHTADEVLSFQDYFVRRRCEPVVQRVEFVGAANAQMPESLLTQMASTELETIVICPSNPFVSVGPILAVPGLKEALARSPAPVVAVSPIVGGKAIKGPAANMLAQLAYPVSALGVARYYADTAPGLINSLIVDNIDIELIPAIRELGIDATATATVMHDIPERCRLASWLIEKPIAQKIALKTDQQIQA
ncbi:MAG: 2-phospho-L-lactate transferase [Congregibacter sp.]